MSELEVIVILAKASLAEGLEQTPGVQSPGAPAARGEAGIAGVLLQYGAALEPVFEPSSPLSEGTFPPAEAELPLGAADAGAEGLNAPGDQAEEEAEMARFFATLIDSEKAEDFAQKMSALDQVETAYVVPPTENPVGPFQADPIDVAIDEGPDAPSAIPSFVSRQTYLAPSPFGIGAANVWSVPGGRGDDVRIIDIEGGWQLSHVDLQPNGGLLAGDQIPDVGWRNHGTAVMGQIMATHDDKGVHGIAPNARMAVVSHTSSDRKWNSARAINYAANRLNPGDVLLLEMHRPGPRFNYQKRSDQLGYIAIEWWPHDFVAIRGAVRRGVIVVEAAGNGAENFDDPLYDTPAFGFPQGWRNPLDGQMDSGAIIVGAGAPASGTQGPPRSRLGFSNYGKRVDCQGWGREVTTTGYGNLFKGRSEDEWFTHTFSGTSSASPIVVGAIAQVQGVSKARGRLVSPALARRLLRQTGAPQTASSIAPLSQRIGRQPDVEAMITTLFG